VSLPVRVGEGVGVGVGSREGVGVALSLTVPVMLGEAPPLRLAVGVRDSVEVVEREALDVEMAVVDAVGVGEGVGVGVVLPVGLRLVEMERLGVFE